MIEYITLSDLVKKVSQDAVEKGKEIFNTKKIREKYLNIFEMMNIDRDKLKASDGKKSKDFKIPKDSQNFLINVYWLYSDADMKKMRKGFFEQASLESMLLNEIINEVGMTKRAVKYYEEKGLLSVDKDNNGYRNYTAQDVETLKKISVYRKLGISIKDIQSLLETGDKSILLRIYQEKVQEKVLKDSELEALKQFIDDGDADKANEALDYQTVENAIESLLPGKEWGDYFKSHFKPFLNVRLKTLEQKQALQNILEYCDETTLKVPFIMGIGAKIIGGIAQETRTADEMIAYYRDMSESEYERLKEKVWKGAKMKNGIMKYHPAFIAQRKMQKELQNKGYNDIFIPNLMVLSPTYAEYKKALDNLNDRMCRELGLYYDSNYNLVIKKDNSK